MDSVYQPTDLEVEEEILRMENEGLNIQEAQTGHRHRHPENSPQGKACAVREASQDLKDTE